MLSLVDDEADSDHSRFETTAIIANNPVPREEPTTSDRALPPPNSARWLGLKWLAQQALRLGKRLDLTSLLTDLE